MPDCSIRSVWRMVQGAIDEVLRKITLKDLLVPEREVSAWPSPGSGATLPTVSQGL
jgi:DNA-binding IscR family transcriptional regulator